MPNVGIETPAEPSSMPQQEKTNRAKWKKEKKATNGQENPGHFTMPGWLMKSLQLLKGFCQYERS